MKRIFTIVSFVILFFLQVNSQNKQIIITDAELDGYNVLVANDLGRNGYYDQKPIAEQMGIWADKADIEFVAAVGDIHHFNGIASVSDPLWMTNYELIYKHPELMLDSFALCGNHEYRGNTQAFLDYKTDKSPLGNAF
ncbi:MAG: hypothetical protein QM751_10730 [Paludibacteraceae bacterium]